MKKTKGKKLQDWLFQEQIVYPTPISLNFSTIISKLKNSLRYESYRKGKRIKYNVTLTPETSLSFIRQIFITYKVRFSGIYYVCGDSLFVSLIAFLLLFLCLCIVFRHSAEFQLQTLQISPSHMMVLYVCSVCGLCGLLCLIRSELLKMFEICAVH